MVAGLILAQGRYDITLTLVRIRYSDRYGTGILGRPNYHVHNVREVHLYLDLIPLSPFVSVRAGLDVRRFLQRSQSLPRASPRN